MSKCELCGNGPCCYKGSYDDLRRRQRAAGKIQQGPKKNAAIDALNVAEATQNSIAREAGCAEHGGEPLD